jgi:hypothetical protein
MLPRRTTPKIIPSEKYLAALVARLIQDKITVNRPLSIVAIRLSFIEISMLVKKINTKARSFYGFKELLGNDEVSIYVSPV